MQQLIIILSLFLVIGCNKQNETYIMVIDRYEVQKGVVYPSGQFKLEWVFDYNNNRRAIKQSDYNPNYIYIDSDHRYKQIKI